MKAETLMRIRGLPAVYVGQPINASGTRIDKIETMVKSLPDDVGIKLLLHGTIGGVIELFDEYYGSQNVAGIDYKAHFASCFDNKSIKLPKTKVVVIYGVGLEKALNLDFSSRILEGVIKELNNNKQHVLLHSEMPNSKFKQKYGIIINNVLNLPDTPDVNLDI